MFAEEPIDATIGRPSSVAAAFKLITKAWATSSSSVASPIPIKDFVESATLVKKSNVAA
jgi:hypothetical protein